MAGTNKQRRRAQIDERLERMLFLGLSALLLAYVLGLFIYLHM